ncbi:YggS family pyridoxal phosphate-dependent enzyme [bacterium]|nr:YggS family pyridoxal phosphate-dependent enzyme [bacterium]
MKFDIRKNLDIVKERIAEAASKSGRKAEDIKLVAVSKFIDIERIEEGIDAGLRILGENRVQEAKEKIPKIDRNDIEWHLVGHLQSNKAKDAVKLFSLIHSIDSLKLASELDRKAEAAVKKVDVLIQFNLSGEETKSGILKDEAFKLMEGLSKLNNIRVLGLMTMPPFFDEPDRARPFFKELRELSEEINFWKIPNITMKYLSMGMTGDFEVAIEEGANIVRIGTAIFGSR